MEITHQGGIADLEISLFAQSPAKLHDSPVPLSSQGWIIHQREDFLFYFVGLESSWSPGLWSVGEAIDPLFIKPLIQS